MLQVSSGREYDFRNSSNDSEQSCYHLYCECETQDISTDTVHNLLSYAQALEGDHGVWRVGMRVMNVEEDKMSSNIISARSIATYVGYVRAGRTMIKPQGMPLFIVVRDKDALAALTVGVTHLTDLRPYFL